MTLTIYTADYDDQDSISDGMSGHVFLDVDENDKSEICGTAFGKLMSDALMHVVNTNTKIDTIMFCYRDKKLGQMFKKFKISQ